MPILLLLDFERLNQDLTPQSSLRHNFPLQFRGVMLSSGVQLLALVNATDERSEKSCEALIFLGELKRSQSMEQTQPAVEPARGGNRSGEKRSEARIVRGESQTGRIPSEIGNSPGPRPMTRKQRHN